MSNITARIPVPDTQPHDISVRAVTPDGPGEPSPRTPFRTIQRDRVRQIRVDGKWRDVSDFGIANALVQLLARSANNEGDVVSTARRLVNLSAEVGLKASAEALQALRVEVEENDGDITALSQSLTSLRTDLAGYATVLALEALTTRVTQSETSIFSNCLLYTSPSPRDS